MLDHDTRIYGEPGRMLFPTHLIAAYAIGNRWELSPYWIVIGAALPDVVDKSIATVGFLDLYQSIGHSLIVLLGLSVVVFVRRDWAAFWVGWASHLSLDALHMIVNGRPGDIRFLAWPVVQHTPTVHLPPIEFLFHYLGTPSFYVEIAIWIGVVFVLIADSRGE